MLLTLTCLAEAPFLVDAREIGFVLHKNPATLLARPLSFGTAYVYYPEAAPERTTVALLVEVDPVRLVRGPSSSDAAYVSDRPYAASSFLSVALSACFATAMAGRAPQRPELVETPLPLTARLTPLACDAGLGLIEALLQPMGYRVSATRLPLDPQFPEWGDGALWDVRLEGRQTVHDLLSHLYVLVPALDNAKHYAFGEDEVEKLLRHGEGWLSEHPARDLIARRYLRYRRRLTESALSRLEAADDAPEPDAETTDADADDTPTRLNDRRIAAAIDAIRTLDPPAQSVLDLGCGEGRTLLAVRKALPRLRLTGMDVSTHALTIAGRRLRERVPLWHGSLVYRDPRLSGFDVALLMEVIEHLDPPRLRALESVVFGDARPRRVFLTTPNAAYNAVWASLPAGRFRHADHRFEWDRAQFQSWAARVAAEHSYQVTFSGVGDEDPDGRGTPTQAAIFDRY